MPTFAFVSLRSVLSVKSFRCTRNNLSGTGKTQQKGSSNYHRYKKSQQQHISAVTFLPEVKYSEGDDEARGDEDGDGDDDGHGHHVVPGAGGRFLLHLGRLISRTVHLVCNEQILD